MRRPLPVEGVRLSLWRAVAAFRVATLSLCLFLIVRWQPIYARPLVALVAGVAMAVITVVVAVAALRGQAHRPSFVVTDLVVTAGLTLLSITAQTGPQQHGAMPTLTTIWAAGPTIEAALVGGPLAGLVAGGAQLAAAMVVRDGYDGRTLNSGVLLVVLGAIVGLLANYVTRAEDDLRVAAAAQAAVAERERLARSVHDGVLQLLALVHRTGRDAGAPWSALAEEAAVHEESLRALITSRPEPGDLTTRDLADDLRSLRAGTVTVSTPGEGVPVPARTAEHVTAAVRAALHNVDRHAGEGARAWVLLEVLDGEAMVTVRDDGSGIPAGRLIEAHQSGRLGVSSSIRGRIAELGGQCDVRSSAGQGTEIEMRVPLI